MNEPPVVTPSEEQFAGPMSFGQILDRIYQLMRDHFRLFMGIALWPAAALFLLMGVVLAPFLLANLHAPNAKPGPAFLISIGAIYPVCFLLFALQMTAASYAAVQSDNGSLVTWRDSYRASFRHLGRYLWLAILITLNLVMPVVVVIALIACGAIWMQHSGGAGVNPAAASFLMPLVVLIYVGVFVYTVFVMLCFAAAYPACVTEELTAWAALKRSVSLTRGGRWRILGVLLICYAVSYVVNLGCIAVACVLAGLGVFVAMMAHVAANSAAFYTLIALGIVVLLVVLSVCTAFGYALYCTALAVLYNDQRRRKEMAPPAAAAPAGPA